MAHEQHLYKYLYDSLVTQLECGYFLQGQNLPSQSSLCKQYNVGITTVRKVFRLLADAGYIHICPGQPAKVAYRSTPQSCASALLRRRQGIADAFGGLGVLMPALYCEGARRCGPEELRTLHAEIDGLDGSLPQTEIYRHANRFFAALLRPFRNPLLMDLQADAETYLRVPYIDLPGTTDPRQISGAQVKRRLEEAVQAIYSGHYCALHKQLAAMYQLSRDRVEQYMDSLSRAANPGPAVEETYSWFTSKGHSELYLQLALSLMRRIAMGEFEGRKYLPSIPALMKEYGVMKDTASRALSLLGSIGVTQTLDKRGTVVTCQGAASGTAPFDLTDRTVRQRLAMCLDALQIMTLTARAGAEAVFPQLHTQYAPLMEARLARAKNLHPSCVAGQLMTGCLIDLVPWHSMENIYQQLNEVMLWGYYLQSAELEQNQPFTCAIRQDLAAFIQAAKAGDRSVFAASMESAFLHIYTSLYQLLSGLAYGGEALPAPL